MAEKKSTLKVQDIKKEDRKVCRECGKGLKRQME